MEAEKTKLEGCVILTPRVFADHRGYFFESYNRRLMDDLIGPVDFVQDNQSKSSYGVVRGLHFQRGEHAQAKLVRVIEGTVLDVAVDINPESPTYGQHVAVELSAENKKQFYIPRGYAHGFAVLSETAVFSYKCDNFYAPEADAGILWNDPALAIDWQIETAQAIISDKDQNLPTLAEYVKK